MSTSTDTETKPVLKSASGFGEYVQHGRELFTNLCFLQSRFMGHEKELEALARIHLDQASKLVLQDNSKTKVDKEWIFLRATEAIALIQIIDEVSAQTNRGGHEEAELFLLGTVVHAWQIADIADAEERVFAEFMLSRPSSLTNDKYGAILREGMRNAYGIEKFLRLLNWANSKSNKEVVKNAFRAIVRNSDSHEVLLLAAKFLQPLYLGSGHFLGEGLVATSTEYVEAMSATYKAVKALSLPFIPSELMHAHSPVIKVVDASTATITYRFGVRHAGELTGNVAFENWLRDFGLAVSKWRQASMFTTESGITVTVVCELGEIKYGRVDRDGKVLTTVKRTF